MNYKVLRGICWYNNQPLPSFYSIRMAHWVAISHFGFRIIKTLKQ
jgi:hypothetical protein